MNDSVLSYISECMHLSTDSRGYSQNGQKCSDVFRNPTGGHHNVPLV